MANHGGGAQAKQAEPGDGEQPEHRGKSRWCQRGETVIEWTLIFFLNNEYFSNVSLD